MTSKLVTQIVEETWTEKFGGQPYFDALDARLRDPEVYQELLDLVDYAFYPHPTLVVSGQFGNAFTRWMRMRDPRQRIIQARGGLRYDSRLDIDHWLLRGAKTIVFVDDTRYGGRTTQAIRQAVARAGRPLTGAVYAYDGSALPAQHGTYSLYRWLDHACEHGYLYGRTCPTCP